MHVLDSPDVSVAVHMMGDGPSVNALGGIVLHAAPTRMPDPSEGWKVPFQLLTVADVMPAVKTTVELDGQTTVGGVVSVLLTVKLHEPTLAAAS